MFERIGRLISRRGSWFVVAWLVLLVGAWRSAPEWTSVAKQGEFDFLPDYTSSRQALKVSNQAFPNDVTRSTIVLVVRREASDSKLLESDLSFVNETLAARLRDLAEQEALRISRVRLPSDELVGPLLVSSDGQAVLVVVELATDFFDLRNQIPVKSVEGLLAELQQSSATPEGLKVSLSGSATLGRDLSAARIESANIVEIVTLLLVIVLLIGIYRAPLPALIPLATVYLAVKLSLKLLSILAEQEVIGIFDGVQTYVTVILYGAGVDYCLFLTARYREEIEAGATYDQAMTTSLGKVGAALVASAGTVIGGIGMMVFAEFGKFREAGVAISFSLIVVLAAVLLLSSVLLRLSGRWAFWPGKLSNRAATTSPVSTAEMPPYHPTGWDWIGQRIAKHPVWTLALCIGLMAPFCCVSVIYHQHVSYGFLSNLPNDAISVLGARDLQAHFPGGSLGPLTVLIRSEQTDFSSSDAMDTVSGLSDWLKEHQEDLQLADVRSAVNPLGITDAAERAFDGLSRLQTISRKSVLRNRANDLYVSQADPLAGHVIRMDLVFKHDPFARDSIAHLDRIEPQLRTAFAKLLPADATLHFLGSTASIRDLKMVRTGDQLRINALVCLTIFVILVMLLRQPFVCLFLVVSMLLGYGTTYGTTLFVFWALDPAGFPGLDWKLPMLLFTILVAVGEDYNIFLMSRVTEEQARYGPIQGVVVALSRTGGIISSCGVIMAGTFSALMFGSLVSMKQLGFALSFGVLLDTFVIRPILVPAFLILWHTKRSGQPINVNASKLAVIHSTVDETERN